MSRIAIVGSHPKSLANFRGDLIKVLVRSGHKVTAMAAPAKPETIREIEELGANYVSFYVLRNRMNPIEDIRTCQSLSRAFKEIHPDIVLAYTVKPVIWSGIVSRKVKGVRFFALITGLGYGFNLKGSRGWILDRFLSFLYRRSLKNSCGVIFQNPDDLIAFARRKIVDYAKSHIVNGSGVNLLRFSESPLPQNGTVFLAIARLLSDKGLREFARAAGLVRERYPRRSSGCWVPQIPRGNQSRSMRSKTGKARVGSPI